MITRIELVNYMSHERTVIEPAPGLTVLAGPNNCGKSAVADALRTVCGMNEGDYMVRHGTKQASVTVETSEGYVVSWKRKGSTPHWEIVDRQVHRYTPEDLQEKLRLPEVETEGSNKGFSVHFADQKQPLFLLGMPASAPAVFFAAASDARYFISMRKAHNQRTKDLKDRRNLFQKDLDRVEQSLSILEPVPQFEEAVEQLEGRFEALQDSANVAAGLQAQCERLEKAEQSVAQHTRQSRCMAALQAPPRLTDTDPLERLQQRMDSEFRNVHQQSKVLEALLPLLDPPELVHTERLEALVKGITEIRRREHHLAKTEEALSVLPSPPSLGETAPLEHLIQSLGRERLQCEEGASRLNALKPLPAPPILVDTAPLELLCERLATHGCDVQWQTARRVRLERLEDPPHPKDPEPLSDLLERIREGRERLEEAHTRLTMLQSLQDPPAMADPSSLATLLDSLKDGHRVLQDHQDSWLDLSREQEDLTQEIRRWLEQHGTCPACGQVLDECLLMGGGVHGH